MGLGVAVSVVVSSLLTGGMELAWDTTFEVQIEEGLA